MLNVNYGNKALYGLFYVKRGQDVVICNVYEANCLFAWVAREYCNETNDKGKKLISSYLWGFFNDIHHLDNCLGLTKQYQKQGNIYDNYFEKIVVKSDVKPTIKRAFEKLSRVCKIPLEIVNNKDLNEYIYGGVNNGKNND